MLCSLILFRCLISILSKALTKLLSFSFNLIMKTQQFIGFTGHGWSAIPGLGGAASQNDGLIYVRFAEGSVWKSILRYSKCQETGNYIHELDLIYFNEIQNWNSWIFLGEEATVIICFHFIVRILEKKSRPHIYLTSTTDSQPVSVGLWCRLLWNFCEERWKRATSLTSRWSFPSTTPVDWVPPRKK